MDEKQYKTGYLCKIFHELGWEDIRLLQRCKEECGNLIVGVPTDDLYSEVLGTMPEKRFDELKEILLLLKAVDEVIPVGRDNLSVQASFRQLQYSCLFYGTEYGRQYQEDKQFLEGQGVAMYSLIPDRIKEGMEEEVFRQVLRKASIEGKIVLFGTGNYFDYYMQKYGGQYPPEYAVDNAREKWNTSRQGVLIREPDVLRNEKAEDVLVILCCKDYQDARNQVLSMGTFDYRLLKREGAVAVIEEYATGLQRGKKYKKGYVLGNFKDFGDKEKALLQECRDRCERLIVGLPSDELILRMEERPPERNYRDKKEELLQLSLADEAVEVDIDNIGVTDSYQKYGYDLYFYGTEYGRQFERDREFLLNKGVSMISLEPKQRKNPEGEDAFWRALQNASVGGKVVLFGTGKYFEYYMDRYGADFPPAYAVDNDEGKWDSRKLGVRIRCPEALREENPQNTIVVLCSREYREIKKQLLSMGEFDYRTLLYCHEAAMPEEYAVILQEEKEYMEKAHVILMKLMVEFDTVCKRHGLKYYVMGGSLIGVVRHKGLIPWDDDVDVAMFRKDYEILREKASEIWKEGSEFLFLDYDQLGNGAFYDFLTRLVYMGEELPTRLFKKVAGKARPDIQDKLVMDIYVMENADNNEKKHKFVTTMMKGIYALSIGHRAVIDYSEYAFLSRPVLMLVRIAAGIGRLIPLKALFYLYEKLRGYARKTDCDYVFESNNGAINYMPWRYKKTIYGEGKTLPMCGYEVMVPYDCDGLLKAKGYGDYMSYPPVNCRKPSHSIKANGVIW